MIEIERSFSAAEIEKIEIEIALGDLSLAAASGDRIGLRAQIRSNDETELEISVAGDTLTIKNRRENNWSTRNASRIDLALSVPALAATTIRVQTGLGDVSADGVSGLAQVLTGKGSVSAARGNSPLNIKAGKGDVTVRAWRGDLEITTGKGDVAVSDLTGGLRMSTGAGDAAVVRWLAPGEGAHQIKTGSGDVAVRQGQAHKLEVQIGRGDCAVQQASLRWLDAHSGMGDLNLAGDPLGGQWVARAGKGDLTLMLAANVAARIEAATRHGQIFSDLPQVKVARPGPASPLGGRSIAVVGDEPRAEIKLETYKGDITVRTSERSVLMATLPTQVTVEAPPAPSTPPRAPFPTWAPVPPTPPTLPASTAPAAPGLTAMSVLESLERGEINADEAEALLRALD
jgi:DUF4097 and DUF4098 domain-containing protein YvlB